jgi:hypothetical protein
MDLDLFAIKPAHAAEEMWKAVQIARPFDFAAAHDRREPQHLRAWLAMPRDEGSERLDHRFERRGARVDAAACPRL